jgi:hypothetical protein
MSAREHGEERRRIAGAEEDAACPVLLSGADADASYPALLSGAEEDAACPALLARASQRLGRRAARPRQF